MVKISDSKGLKLAIRELGSSAKDKASIIKVAKNLGLTNTLPSEWRNAKSAGKFRYWMTVEKAISQDGEIYVQGVATGSKVDGDNERMGPAVIRTFFNTIKNRADTNNPLPLTDGHPKGGGILAEVGDIVDAQILPNNDLFIKAKLDKNHPSTSVLTDRINKGKKYAFSIEGWLDKPKRTIFIDGNKTIQEYTSLVPKSVSITTEPSYLPSFLEVVSKAARNYEDLNTIKDVDLYTLFKRTMGFDLSTYKSMQVNKLLINKNTMNKIAVSANPQPVEDATTVQNAVGTSQEGNDTETNLDINTQDNVTENVDSASADNTGDTMAMICAALETMGYKVTKMDEDDSDDQEGDEAENPADDAIKADAAQDINNPAFEDLKGTQKTITAKLDLITKTFKSQNSEISKMMTKIMATQESMHKDVEILKELPLAKKSKIVTKSLSFNDRAAITDPFTEQYRSLKENGQV